jgi:NADPH-dependent curcumin reductase CurA
METLYVSIDPVMRVWLSGAKTYLPALKVGDTMHGFCLSKPVGKDEYYFGTSGLRTHFFNPGTLQQIPKEYIDRLVKAGYTPGSFVNLTLNGLTSCVGLLEVCNIKNGQNVIISSAAGATGILAIQIATKIGCNVLGLTSKVETLKKLFPKISVVDYRSKTLAKDIKEVFPKGVDAYFDNVGEGLLDQVLGHMKDFGTIALCGATSTYVEYGKRTGLQNSSLFVTKRLQIKGFTFVSDRL